MILVPTLHCAYLLRSGDESTGQARFEQTVVADLKKAFRLAKERPQWEESVVWERDGSGRLKNLFPTAQEVFDFIAGLYQSGPDPVVTIDIETTKESPVAAELLCVGLGYTNALGHDVALCVPFLAKGRRPYWLPEAFQYVWSWLRTLFADRRVRKNLQNGAFDTVVLHCHGAPVENFFHDTMIAHHIIDSELPHGLGYLGTRYLDIAYWKDDAKGTEKNVEVEDEVLRAYNLKDILVTHRLRPILEREVSQLGLWDLYQEELALSRIMARATLRGVGVDPARRQALADELNAKKTKALAELKAIAGGNVDPQKPAHLKYLLFDQLRFPVVKKTATGKPCTDKDALVLLALAAETDLQKKCLAALVDFRTSSKALSTWAENLQILADGRVHATWKMLTTSGRMASSPNMQNHPKSIQRIFKAGPPGKGPDHPDADQWTFVGVDLSQAELRFIAYTANDPELLMMYRGGIDVHTVNIALLFGVRCPTDDPKAAENTNAATEAFLSAAVPRLLGKKYEDFPFASPKKWKSIRTLAKNFEFGTNYGASAETVFDVLRAKRDDNGKQLFPDLDLALIEALLAQKLKLRPALEEWWAAVSLATQQQGYFKCPVSGRVRFFRDGFKRNEMLNVPIQAGVASVMNKRLILLQSIFDQETGGECQIVLQVHDALTFECRVSYAERCKQLIAWVMAQPFSLPGHPQAMLPADPAKIACYADQV